MAAKKRSKAKASSGRRVALPKPRSAKVAPSKKKRTNPKASAKPAAKKKKASASEPPAKKAKPKARPPSGKPARAKKPTRAKEKVAAKPTPIAVSLGSSAVGVGAAAPAFELPDQTGEHFSSASLAGQPYVLYFYPKDDTPGCTVQACGFRDSATLFDGLRVRVIGVSPDSVASHQRFIAKYELPFSLLSDAEQKLASAYGVWSLKKNYGREYMGIVRSTFLVDKDGVIRNTWRGVRVKGHVDEVHAAARDLS